MMNRLLCAAVLSALAIDTLAGSVQHKHRHAKKQVDWNDPSLYKDVNWASVFGNPAAAAAPTPAAELEQAATATESPVPDAPAQESPSTDSSDTSSDTSSNTSSDTGSGSSGGAGFGARTAAVVGNHVDVYKGNVGSPFGSNIIKVSSVDGYTYTNKFLNDGSSAIKVIVWNKAGPDGRPNSGQFSTPVLEFPLAAGASQLVAFDVNTQCAFCAFPADMQGYKKTQWGAYDCTYGEADFGNESNGGWSGYDVSSIQNTGGNNTPMKMTEPNGAVSSNQGNNYVSDKQPGGIGGNLAPGNVRLETTFGQ